MDSPWKTTQANEVRKEAKGVGLIEKAVDILDIVGMAPGTFNSSELSAKTGLPRSSFYRIAQALVRRGLLRVDSDSQTYHLGYRLLEMVKRAGLNSNLLIAADVELRRLRDLASETVYLGVLDGTEIVVIDRHESPYEIRSQTAIGGRKPLHCSSEGKALLAFLPAAELQDLLPRLSFERFTERTVRDRASLEAQLKVVQFRGYAADEGELLEGVRCVGAPILDDKGRAVAAIGVAGPMFRFTIDRVADIGGEAVAAAKRLAKMLTQLQSGDSLSIPSTKDVIGIAQTHSFIASSPVWHDKSAMLYWTDAMGPVIYSCKPGDGLVAMARFEGTVGALFLDRDGSFVAGIDNALVRLDDQLRPLDTILTLNGDQASRIVSGRADGRGGIWMLVQSGLVDDPASSLWYFDHLRSPVCIADGLTVAPGFDFGRNGRTLYLSDPRQASILACDLDGDQRPKVAFRCPPDRGQPFGVAVDSSGGIWCPHWDGWCVTRYLPGGEVDRTVPLPVPRPSGCTLGGADGNTLFVVTSRIGLSTRFLGGAPDSGALYAIRAA